MRRFYEEPEYCEGCGDDIFEDDFDTECAVCGDGHFCDSCIDEHMEEEHSPKCRACGVKLEVDPPCPICCQQFCDNCIGGHMALCQANEDTHTGVQPTLFRFIFEDGLTNGSNL